MREIKGEAITQAVARLCMSANRNLPQDVRACITQSQAREPWEPARGILAKIVENYKIAGRISCPFARIQALPASFWRWDRRSIFRGIWSRQFMQASARAIWRQVSGALWWRIPCAG